MTNSKKAWKMGNGKWQMVRRPFTIFLLPFAMLFAGCNLNPFSRARDASNGGATGSMGGRNFVIFNNELLSGGGAFEYPGSEGQSLSFNDTSNSVSRRSIRYSWTGEPPDGEPRDGSVPTFAGFDLMFTPTFDAYQASQNSPGRDLRAARYTKVTFYARGQLSTNTVLKIEVSANGNPNNPAPCLVLSTDGTDPGGGPSGTCTVLGGPNPFTMSSRQLTSAWQQYTISVPNSALASIKDFFKSTFVYYPIFGAPSGQGGTAYFDVIQYEP